jgi:hypothetical protein
MGGPHNVHANDDSFRCANRCDGAGEMLPDDQILAWRFACNPYDKRQSWFRNVAITDGDIATITPYRPRADGFRIFDPSCAVQPARDRLTFAFKDCNHGRIDFTSSVTGCGDGHMDPTRLTQRRVFVSVSQIGSLNHRSTP